MHLFNILHLFPSIPLAFPLSLNSPCCHTPHTPYLSDRHDELFYEHISHIVWNWSWPLTLNIEGWWRYQQASWYVMGDMGLVELEWIGGGDWHWWCCGWRLCQSSCLSEIKLFASAMLLLSQRVTYHIHVWSKGWRPDTSPDIIDRLSLLSSLIYVSAIYVWYKKCIQCFFFFCLAIV